MRPLCRIAASSCSLTPARKLLPSVGSPDQTSVSATPLLSCLERVFPSALLPLAFLHPARPSSGLSFSLLPQLLPDRAFARAPAVGMSPLGSALLVCLGILPSFFGSGAAYLPSAGFACHPAPTLSPLTLPAASSVGTSGELLALQPASRGLPPRLLASRPASRAPASRVHLTSPPFPVAPVSWDPLRLLKPVNASGLRSPFGSISISVPFGPAASACGYTALALPVSCLGTAPRRAVQTPRLDAALGKFQSRRRIKSGAHSSVACD